MTGNDARLDWRQVSFNDVQIGTTNPAGHYPKQNMPGFKPWTRNILQLQK